MNFLGDFSRWTFDPRKRFTRVLQQQGRVHVDADWNEQGAIFWYYLRALAEDIGGPHWGPWPEAGFRVEPAANAERDFLVRPGAYYVRGMRCENHRELRYTEQPGADGADLEDEGSYLVYLEAWERHVSYVEDPALREVALGGGDTAVRAELAWQVKVSAGWGLDAGATRNMSHDELVEALFARGERPRPRLRVKAGLEDDAAEDPCEQPVESRFGGPENQLYRVEIHRGGTAETATFKWSRDNAVTFPVESRQGAVLTLAHLGRDPRVGLDIGDWVEVVDDASERRAGAHPLLQVEDIDRGRRQVTLSGEPAPDVGTEPSRHPRLRRWDHRAGRPEEGGAELVEGALRVREGEGDAAWIELEDGIRIQFREPSEEGRVTEYRTGDYWWIPARATTGNVEWPVGDDQQPMALEPHGVERFYAPLAILTLQPAPAVQDTRWLLEPPRKRAGQEG